VSVIIGNAGDGRHLTVQLEDHVHFWRLLAMVKGLSTHRWNPQPAPGHWTIPFNVFQELMDDVADLGFECPVHISDAALRMINQWKDLMAKRVELKTPLVAPLNMNGCWKLDANDPNDFPMYQQTMANFLYRSRRAICGDPVGCGKTVMGLAASVLGITNDRYSKVIVIMPRENLRKKWGAEIEKFCVWKHYQVTGSPGQRRAIYRQFVEDPDPGYLCIMYSTVRSDADDLLRILTASGTVYGLIVDEVQHCKHYGSKQSKGTQKLRRDAQHVYGLSATYMEGKLEELHSVMRVIDPAVLGTWTGFMGRYIRQNFYNWDYVRVPECKRKIEPYIFRRLIDDLDHMNALPDEVYIDYYVSLTRPQRDLYRAVLEEERLKRTKRETNANQIAIEMLRERQVCLFPQMLEPGITDSPKLAELIRIIEEDIEPDARIVVFCFFQEAVEILTEELNKRWRTIGIHGGMRLSVSDVKREFTTNKGIRILVTSDVFREGDDLVDDSGGARVVINFDLLANPAWMDQRKGRLTRFSQIADKVVIINIITRKTVEEYFHERLLLPKRNLMKDVMDDGRESVKVRREAFDVVAQHYRG
jgi:SNF2 family DNA or RNA helicase